MKKKILHLITGLEIGGAEKMLLKTLPRLQNDFDNRVCCIVGHGLIGEELSKKGIIVTYLDLKNIFDLEAIFRFKGVIDSFQPDLLVTYLIHADLFGRVFGRLFGVKRVVCSVRVKLIQFKYLPLLFFDVLTSFLVNKYHFNSFAVAGFYKKYFGFNKNRSVVIPNGIEVDKYQVDINKNVKKKELGIPLETFVIGCVAKLRKQKGHEYLLKAFNKVAECVNNCVLVLVGDGEERTAIKKMIVQLKIEDRVIMLGDRKDIPGVLKIFDIFVLPTLYEGMSNAILEAMASGLPIVITNIPENCELVEDGKTALLVKTKEVEELKNAMLKLIKNPLLARNLGKEARNVVNRKYNIDMVVQRLGNFYNAICQ